MAEGIYLALQVVEGSVVPDDAVGERQTFGARGLGRDAPARFGLSHAATRDETADGDVLGAVDYDDLVTSLPAGLHEKGDFEDDDAIGVGSSQRGET